MEQNWLKSESGTEIDIDCIVYSDPSPQVHSLIHLIIHPIIHSSCHSLIHPFTHLSFHSSIIN